MSAAGAAATGLVGSPIPPTVAPAVPAESHVSGSAVIPLSPHTAGPGTVVSVKNTPPPAAPTVLHSPATVSPADAGDVISLLLGQSFVLQLGPPVDHATNWVITAAPSNVLAQASSVSGAAGSITIPAGQGGKWIWAVGSGQATITAVGNYACWRAKPSPCELPASGDVWQVRVQPAK